MTSPHPSASDPDDSRGGPGNARTSKPTGVSVNPYAAPRTDEVMELEPDPPEVKRALAGIACAICTLVTLGYTWMDEVVLETRLGAWPMLFGASVAAMLTAWFTRDLLLSPACCFVAVIVADLLAAVVRSWGYAQFHLCVPLAGAFSLPAILIAWLRLRRYRAERAAA